ncbi:MAG: glycosyltransferase [Acidimicrobiia bacterium]|nr:glycosyltransferase [Acidimicrobiia bacterium]
MRVLFLHPNFPAQFRHLAPTLAADPANEVVFATTRRDGPELDGVVRARYQASRQSHPDIHPYVRTAERAVLAGQAVLRTADDLRRQGFRPDVVVAHSGWGPAVFVKELFPACRMLTYLEWWFRPGEANLGYLPDEGFDDDDALRNRTNNVQFLLDLAETDWVLTPTRFQADQVPAIFRRRLSVCHDGVDTTWFTPTSPADGGPTPPGGLSVGSLRLPPGREIVTFATRCLEPYRGFPQFMRAAGELLARRPQLEVVVAGRDDVAYGTPLPPGDTWPERMRRELSEAGVDLSRLHLVGPLPYGQYRALLRASTVHTYLTVPFVLSWSMLEAMSTGCAIVGSDTEPVRELIVDGHNGLLADFFDHRAFAARIEELLDDPAKRAALGAEARRTIVNGYDLGDQLGHQIDLIGRLARGELDDC